MRRGSGYETARGERFSSSRPPAGRDRDEDPTGRAVEVPELEGVKRHEVCLTGLDILQVRLAADHSRSSPGTQTL